MRGDLTAEFEKGGRSMIRINLLAVERERSKKKATFQTGHGTHPGE